jgi:Flp pilus assembly pilin Flp
MLQRLWWLDRRAGRWSRGQGLVEYALILMLVAVIVIVVVALLGDVVYNTLYEEIYQEVILKSLS